MRSEDIKIGHMYRLKSTRQQAYGLPGCGEFIIDNITYRDTYKTPFVWSGVYAFHPSDFSCEVFS